MLSTPLSGDVAIYRRRGRLGGAPAPKEGKHLGGKGREVRGIVLLDSLPDDLGHGAAAVADTVEFKRYRPALTFESVDVV